MIYKIINLYDKFNFQAPMTFQVYIKSTFENLMWHNKKLKNHIFHCKIEKIGGKIGLQASIFLFIVCFDLLDLVFN